MFKRKTKLWDWQERIKQGQERCGCGSQFQLTVDHIIPQSLLQQLGLFDEIYEDEENFEVHCRLCNSQKGNKIDVKHPKVFPLLEKYLRLSKSRYQGQ